jgi:hypothetical protein
MPTRKTITAAIALAVLATAPSALASSKTTSCPAFRPVGVPVVIGSIRAAGATCKQADSVGQFGLGWAMYHRNISDYLQGGTGVIDFEYVGTKRQEWSVTFTTPTGANAPLGCPPAVVHAVVFANAPDPRTGKTAILASVSYTITTDVSPKIVCLITTYAS